MHASLVLIRHGKSVWNAQNRFTGWVDVPLAAEGWEEAARAGRLLADRLQSAPPLGIGEGTVIERAIVDKNARIGRNVRLVNSKGLDEADGDGWAIRDGIVVVVKNAVIPDGTVI